MASEAYELLALGMRYWFVLLGLAIVVRAGRWAWHDHRVYLRTLSKLPDAGYMGEIVNLASGEAQPLPREGVIGSGKTCDIRYRGLRRRELTFELREGSGVKLASCHRRHQIGLDGTTLAHSSFALHGSQLDLPGYRLRLRLFEGLDVPVREQRQGQEVFQGDTFIPSAWDEGLELGDTFAGAADAMPSAPPSLWPMSSAMDRGRTAGPLGEDEPENRDAAQYEAPVGEAAAPFAWREQDVDQVMYPEDEASYDPETAPSSPGQHKRRRRSERHEEG
ncbi:MAG: hypothetical protein AB9880_03775 [Christensenellales bacterium]